MTADEVIHMLQLWNSGRMSESYRIYADMADAVQALRAENAELRKAFPYCDAHKPSGESRSVCPICAMTEYSYALSRIDYLFGEPNDMELSQYDVEQVPTMVLERLKTKLAELRRLNGIDPEHLAHVEYCEKHLAELRDEIDELSVSYERTCHDVTHWKNIAEGFLGNNTELRRQIDKLREQQVRYVEIDRLATLEPYGLYALNYGNQDRINMGYGIYTPEKRSESLRLFRIENLPPRTPENTVPLKKEPSVVEQAAKVMRDALAASGEEDQDTDWRLWLKEANALNAAGLLREEPQ